MRWFKHFTDNHRGRSVQTLMDQMGHAGLGIYILMELCAEKLHKDSGNILTSSDLVFRFHPRVLDNALRMKRKSTENILRISQECNLLKYVYSENEVIIEMPILLNLLEKNYKKSPLRGLKVSQKVPLDTEQIQNRYRTEHILPKTRKKSSDPLNLEIWSAYELCYENRYGVKPTRNASVNGKISQIAKRLGAEAIEVVKFYVLHNDAFYIRKAHAIGLCLSDAESLHTQWKTGKQITGSKVRQFEKKNETQELINDIMENGI